MRVPSADTIAQDPVKLMLNKTKQFQELPHKVKLLENRRTRTKKYEFHGRQGRHCCEPITLRFG